ncbi:exodeoxyribonuclease VII large subunit [Thermosipho melanesiensis]|uniref:exodeoxyribonuclease VII large subunit n=1 Tax=Thermosipho melanesiensis TaxID=46541 RepID=UPI001E5A07EF|nr:exodeoxyribonuclease VII large subunit [Thermosipho melanesiensis]
MIELNEYVTRVIDSTGLTSETFRFYADVVRANIHSSGLYIDVSQTYPVRNGTRNIEITVYIPKYMYPRMLAAIGLRNAKGLVGKKWIFQGKLSFYKDRMSFTFFADTIAPVGESEIEKRKKEILRELKLRNLLMLEKHDLSELPPIKKIAVISSKTAAGYEDFLKNLKVGYLYQPIVHLYESPMQGANTAAGIILALERIKRSNIDYNVVVIARGGGAKSDLMYFDDLALGVEIANFNNYCPVLSGIGHERDFTIPDYVAWKRFATPTEVARAISRQIDDNVRQIDDNWNDLKLLMMNILKNISTLLNTQLVDYINKTLKVTFLGYEDLFENYYENLKNHLNYIFEFSSRKISEDFLSFISQRMEGNLNAKKGELIGYAKLIEKDFALKISNKEALLNQIFQELLKKEELAPLLFGGAIVMKGRKKISSVRKLRMGEKIEIYLKDGKINAKISNEKKKKKEELYGGHTLFRS